MNAAHLHLLTNHIPIVGIIIGLLILAAGFIFKNTVVKRTALAVFIFAALLAVPAFLTGEGAEELIEDMAGISHQLIEEHEDKAAVFIWLIEITGILAAATLILSFSLKKSMNLLYVIVFCLAAASAVYAFEAGNSGGLIRHSELRQNP